MRYTACFWVKTDKVKYSVANTHPKKMIIGKITELIPPWDLVNDYKKGIINDNDYKEVYMKRLENLGVTKILELIPDNSIICCWEKKGFCHRHLIAEFLGEEYMIELEG
ncbi:MAG: hypothetical protein WC175_06540 [Candidatus Dojkabacteria bacterium]